MRRAYIYDYKSQDFPIIAKWNTGKNTNVFGNFEQAKNYLIGRFGKITIIDKRRDKKA